MTITILLITTTFLVIARAQTPFPFDPGFPIAQVAQLAQTLPTHSWEHATAFEMLLELYTPEASVFGSSPFSNITSDDAPALEYARQHIHLGSNQDSLANGDGSVGDPTSLGVAAVMLGRNDEKYSRAVDEQIHFLLTQTPRCSNGAISHRATGDPELWADFMYMAPPTLAYYAVNRGDADMLREAVDQCGRYREVLRASDGAWMHIVTGKGGAEDLGVWSTGNGWAAAGMLRVLATLIKAPLPIAWRESTISEITSWIQEILDGTIKSLDNNTLLRNYLDDASWFPEISGSSLLASVAYRLAPLVGQTKYIPWADSIREALGKDGHVTQDGVVSPAVNPLAWKDREPWMSGSPEGNCFVGLMYAAWRDCVLIGVCEK